MAPSRAHSCMVLVHHRIHVVEEEHRRSDRLDSGHAVVVDSRPSGDRDVAGRTDHHERGRSSHAAVECADGNHHDADCSRAVGRGGRSIHRSVADRDRGRGSLVSGNGSVRVDVERQFGASWS